MRFKFELVGNELCLDADCTLSECADVSLMLINMQYESILSHFDAVAGQQYRTKLLKQLIDPESEVWKVQNDT